MVSSSTSTRHGPPRHDDPKRVRFVAPDDGVNDESDAVYHGADGALDHTARVARMDNRSAAPVGQQGELQEAAPGAVRHRAPRVPRSLSLPRTGRLGGSRRLRSFVDDGALEEPGFEPCLTDLRITTSAGQQC